MATAYIALGSNLGDRAATLLAAVRELNATPGVRVADNSTVRLDLDNEPQPDVAVFLDPKLGGQALISPDGYIERAPELVAEVTASTVSIDLGPKKHVYRRNGVREYVVWRVLDQAIDWFALRHGQYARRTYPAILGSNRTAPTAPSPAPPPGTSSPLPPAS